MGDRPWSACFAQITLQFFCANSSKSGRPTGPLNFFFKWQKSNSSRSRNCQIESRLQRRLWSPRLRMVFDTVSQSVYFPFSNSSFPSNIFIRGPKYSQSISWFVSKTTKSHQGTAKKVCITCTWQLLFIAILPNSCFSC
jgi:hypothetical protein